MLRSSWFRRFGHPGHSLPVFFLLTLGSPLVAAEKPNGELIYKGKCASCHGAKGEGSKRHKGRLEGERTVGQLAEVIRKTMPESSPGSLSADEARAVAEFVHGAFYSRSAREKNRPDRIELARLTVPQYRNAVADLIGSFRRALRRGKQQGLTAEYFRDPRFLRRDRLLERIEPRIVFDGSETQEKTVANSYSIRWTGSLRVATTGEYEFVVRTEHCARLWVNDLAQPLIDAWVKSGNEKEYRGKRVLLAGRSYPLRLWYTKALHANTGKRRGQLGEGGKTAIALLWQQPGQPALKPIGKRYLDPRLSPESFVCSTPFPPDDSSSGWESGGLVSEEWEQATTAAALEAADYVAKRLDELSGVPNGQDRQKLLAFCWKFAELAFRAPLSKARKAAIEREFAAEKDPRTGVKRVVLRVLKSPLFLYREVSGGPAAYDVAARLSFSLWDSLPDRELLDAAAAGKLSTREQVIEQAERMMKAAPSKTRLRHFLFAWLKANRSAPGAKDPLRFPGFDGTLVSDLRMSLELFLDDVLWSEKSDFRQLFLCDEVFLNNRLAKMYRAGRVEAGQFHKVKLDAGRRAGVLTHPYLLAAFADSRESAPIHRGVFLAGGVLGVNLQPPADAPAPLPPALHPRLTTRERTILQTKPATCMTCHGIINSLGFTLEHFDAIGRYRRRDNGKPVNATGSYVCADGNTVKVNGARELAAFLAESPEVQNSFIAQLFHHLVQQPIRAYGPSTLEELRRSFVRNGFHMRKLVAEVMAVAAMKPRIEPVRKE